MSDDDATTRARIRDAAIRLIGRDGFKATTVRAIADEAGVSAALVIHHFGSKDGLREACDQWILAQVYEQGNQMTVGGAAASASIRRWLDDIDAHRPWLEYIGRLLMDGSSAGDRVFDDMVAYTEDMFAKGVTDGSVRPSDDPRMRAVLLTAYGLSIMTLERQLARAMGEPRLTSALATRMTIPATELFTHGIYTGDTILNAVKAAVGDERKDGSS